MIATIRKSTILVILLIASTVSANEFKPHAWTSFLDNPAPHVLPIYNDKTAINELVNACPDFYEELSQECNQRLTEFFMEVPYWASTTFEQFFGDRNWVLPPLLNDRFRLLEYGYEEFAIDDAPAWRDIFDGKFEHRGWMTIETLRNPRCVDLGKGSEIRPELAYECQARELFKYAAHLDACATAIDRHSFASPRSRDSNELLFDRGLEGVAGSLESDPEKLELVLRIHTIWNLQIAWLVQRCHDDQLILPDLGLASGGGASAFSLNTDDLSVALNPVHDSVLRIAAKAGDAWAIQSHYPGSESDAYLRNLHRVNPALVHRYVATLGGHRVTPEEQLQHAVKAYMHLKEINPSANFDLWEYVFGGGHLRLNQTRFNQNYGLPNAVRDVTSSSSQAFPWLNAPIDHPMEAPSGERK